MAVAQIVLNRPYPKQLEFYQSGKRYTGYGGSRGGGKSDVSRNKAVLLGLRYAGIQILFMRRTYPEIKENHVIPCQRMLKGIAKYNNTDKAFEFPNGARLKFGYCRNESDLLQYQGQAYDVIFLEECTQFPEIVFTTLTESNRSSGLMTEYFKPRMYFTCNPGGVGHAWFKRLFIDRQYRDTERAEDYKFIQASVYDNPWLMKNSPDYVRALENLPEKRKRAMLHGDWDVFEGQYFPEFSRETHTCAPFPIPAHWRRYRVFDYGFDMFACYFVAADETGRAWFYKEIYEGQDKTDQFGNPGEGLTIAQAARKMLEMTTAEENILCTFAPPDMWNRRQETGRSAADIFAEYGVPLYKASNNRVQGWMDVRDWMQVPDKVNCRAGEREGALEQDGSRPRIMIFDNCTNLIRTLPLLLHDEKNPDDVAKEPHEVTHAPDAVRYFVSAQPLAAQLPQERDGQTYEEEFADYDDYNGF